MVRKNISYCFLFSTICLQNKIRAVANGKCLTLNLEVAQFCPRWNNFLLIFHKQLMHTFLKGMPGGFGSDTPTLGETCNSLTQLCQQHYDRFYCVMGYFFFLPCVTSEIFVVLLWICAFDRSVKDSGKQHYHCTLISGTYRVLKTLVMKW